MAELSNPPLAPPPPPPTLFKPSKILEDSKRPPTNSNRILGLPTSQSTQRPPFAGVHPETLQHAAASLRKTQHREPLLSFESNTELGRSNHLPIERHWSNFAQYAPLVSNSTGTTIPVTLSNTNQSSTIGLQHKYTDSLKSSNSKVDTNTSINNNNLFFNELINPNKSHIFAQENQNLINNAKNSNVYVRHVPINVSPSINSLTKNTIQPNLNQPKKTVSNNFSSVLQTEILNENKNNSFVSQPCYNSTKTLSNDFATNNQNNNFSTFNTLPIIKDPKSYINNYATKTPITVLNENSYEQKNLNTNKKNYDFVKDLRNSGLTERQKYLNTFKESLIKERSVPKSFNLLYQNPNEQTKNLELDSVDALIQNMSKKLQTTAQDVCAQCKTAIEGDVPGVTALGNSYHVSCFTCSECKKQLAGCSFYNVDGRHLCQVDYMNFLEKCDKCGTPITQKILRAMNKAFHPECFKCPACNKSLDGIPFTVDKQNHAYCLECYHEKFSPRCAACLKVIAPVGNETEVARVIAMDQSYHIDCYKCEDCNMKLNSKIEGQGCYPIESHLLCKNCNLNRLKDNYQPTVA